MNVNSQEIEKRIRHAIPDADVTVEDSRGDGYHYAVRVRSASFEGLNRLQQHQRVYAAIGSDVGNAIHALSLETQTP